jgi:protease PrsW
MGIYYFTFIFLSLVPSVLWLIFFLQEDKKPEPGRKILNVFFWGMMASIPVIVITLPINSWLVSTGLSRFTIDLIMIVAVAAIVEELAKFFVIRQSVLKSSECDEPIDLMIYAITAGLGFAALENFLLLLPIEIPFSQGMMAIHSFIRFFSGTFLHALVGGVMGYFIALSILDSKKRTRLIFTGVSLSILLHACYNFSIIYFMAWRYVVILAPILLITLFIVVFLCFNKLKKMASICKI